VIIEVRAGRERRPAQVADELAPDVRRPVGTRSPRRFVLSCLEPQACLVVRLEFCTGRGDPEGDGFVTRRALCAQVGRMLDADMASDLGGELSLIVALGAPEGSKQMALLLVDEESLLDVHAVADIALSPLGFSLRTAPLFQLFRRHLR